MLEVPGAGGTIPNPLAPHVASMRMHDPSRQGGNPSGTQAAYANLQGSLSPWTAPALLGGALVQLAVAGLVVGFLGQSVWGVLWSTAPGIPLAWAVLGAIMSIALLAGAITTAMRAQDVLTLQQGGTPSSGPK